MRSDQLQQFIEDNKGKKYGEKYIYEGTILIPTRVLEPFKVIDVYLILPWTTFCERVEYEKIANHVMFFDWLTDIFIPLAEQRLKKE